MINKMNKTVTVAIIGAGDRGRGAYGQFIKNNSDKIKAVAVAEPNQKKRKLFADEHNIKEKLQYNSWENFLNQKKLADGIIISTLDNMHLNPVLYAMEKGYKILLEKPITPNLNDTFKVLQKAQKTNSDILVCHVLRYTPFYQKLKKILKKEYIGKIRFINHIEKIGYYHFAHSYVRGNWRNTSVAAPIILAKSCHDLDLLYWLTDEKCIELSSHASLDFFNENNHPKGATNKCLDCSIESECPYSAKKIYLNGSDGWPTSVITDDFSYEAKIEALRKGPYGRCVYKCDNNVPEVQTIRMTLTNNIEVNFALTAFSDKITRKTSIFGTKGEINADFDRGIIKINKFGFSEQKIKVKKSKSGHNGGDAGVMKEFIKMIQGKNKSDSISILENSIESHIMAHAAEKSRFNNKVIYLDNIRKSFNYKE
ncbi:Gfo/Idh/MocA family protein [Halanaerobium kushneri]|uniref:Oxidoreductase family, NAD-binding Rossmann fold n=1 Tax=Halanaerobium kushneri TaxID=56779 RepID=A0A1N6R1G5_9FIRM|nr:Gfo/Idh/MocA family oxidoreductase [Halanaerobium kushneri]SIQ22639.1 Oxidoreductase family, NAD-binding Rossmann fold [Halanaerobium kushneri]